MDVAPPPPDIIADTVRRALREDVGSGDVTAALVAATTADATLVSREAAVLCGSGWFDEVYRQLDDRVVVTWRARDGDPISPDQIVCSIAGSASSILTGERAALNLLQSLSGTATIARRYADAVRGTGATVLDTRKTIPGLRVAQKYAVRCGGCTNHRMGLFDAVLIKENHILAAGGIVAAIGAARRLHPTLSVEVEVEDLAELDQALEAGANVIMLDNFDLPSIREAVRRNDGRANLEASGNVELDILRELAKTGVDYISVGALTKHLQAVDFSLRLGG